MTDRLRIADNQPENRTPDPWGVRRAEMLLQSLKGVHSARVVVSPDGEIKEIHVLTESTLTAKQVVRNVESALLAQLGIKVDHRRISVAQTESALPPDAGAAVAAGPQGLEAARTGAVVGLVSEPEPEPELASEEEPEPELPGTPEAVVPMPRVAPDITPPAAAPLPQAAHPARDVLYQRVEVVSTKPNKVRVTVVLQADGQDVRAAEESADTPNMRLLAAARATVSALDNVVEGGTLDLVGAQFVEAFDTTFVFVGVNVVAGRDTHLHTGTCEVRRGAEQAAALAVLDATNRWLRTGM